jgi:hypothetical protein
LAEQYSSSLWLKCSIGKTAQRSIDWLPEEEERPLRGNPRHEQKRAALVSASRSRDRLADGTTVGILTGPRLPQAPGGFASGFKRAARLRFEQHFRLAGLRATENAFSGHVFAGSALT